MHLSHQHESAIGLYSPDSSVDNDLYLDMMVLTQCFSFVIPNASYLHLHSNVNSEVNQRCVWNHWSIWVAYEIGQQDQQDYQGCASDRQSRHRCGSYFQGSLVNTESAD